MTYRALDWRSLLFVAAVALIASALVAFARPVIMTVDGQRIESDVPPVTIPATNRIFVPLRTMADALGAETALDEKTGRIDVTRGRELLRLQLGDKHAALDGMPMTLKTAPFLVRGRIMIDANALGRAFGVRVTYDPRTSRIDVITPGVGDATTSAASQEQAQ